MNEMFRRFEKFCDDLEQHEVENVIKASDNILRLTGKGTEYLLDQNGDVRAVFLNGNFTTYVQGNTDVTIPVAA